MRTFSAAIGGVKTGRIMPGIILQSCRSPSPIRNADSLRGARGMSFEYMIGMPRTTIYPRTSVEWCRTHTETLKQLIAISSTLLKRPLNGCDLIYALTDTFRYSRERQRSSIYVGLECSRYSSKTHEAWQRREKWPFSCKPLSTAQVLV